MKKILLSLLSSSFATLKHNSLFYLYSPLAFKMGKEVYFSGSGVVVTQQTQGEFIVLKQSQHAQGRMSI